MGIVVIVAIVAVIWLAGSNSIAGTSSDPNASGGLQPSDTLPALGATDKFSPALTGGLPMINRGNRIRLFTNYSNTANTVRPSAVPATMASVGVFGGNTNQSNDGGYARQTAPRFAASQTSGIQSGKVYQPFKF
jgi:hypothetical protein